MGSTKEEIMTVALHLFAKNGYEAVSVSQIAGVLGMTKGALYRHYENKRDIFLHIVKRMEQQDSEQARQNEVPEESINLNTNLIADLDLESLDLVTLVSEIENKYELEIPDKEIKKIQTVEDIVNFLSSHV